MVKRIRPARHYQRNDDPALRLMLAARPKIARDLRGAMAHLPSLVDGPRMVHLIKAGRLRELHDAVDWNHYREILKATFARIADAYQEGAALGVRKINGTFAQARRRVRFRKGLGSNLGGLFDKAVPSAAGRTYNFDMYNTDTQQALRDAQDALIQQLEQDARDTIEQAVMAGALEGLSAADIVDDIRMVIGLTDFQANAVLNYQRMLEELDPTALARQLRNTTMDQVVQDAIDSGDFLPSDTIDQMVQDYTDNYLDYRAETIAQTESVRAVNQGLHDSYSQAIDRGALPAEAVKREWQLGDSPCPICESIPDNNPDGVGVDETFDSDDGPIDDPPVHPNACFAGTEFSSYGSVKQMSRAKYKGPAIILEAIILNKNCSESTPRHAAVTGTMAQGFSYASQLHGESDLLISNLTRSPVSVTPSLINLTIGPNHPMLSRRGFITAREIKETDELLYDLRAVPLSDFSSEIDFKQMKLFEDAFSALQDSFPVVRGFAAARSYFHGDEVFTYGEVDIVFPKRDLLPVLDSGGVEHLCKCPLMKTYADSVHVASCRPCQERFEFVFRSASGNLSGADNSLPLGFTKPLPSFFHCARVVSAHWSTFEGLAFDASTSNAIYNAGGFVVKNCQCSVDYITDISQILEDDSQTEEAA